jgi:soluble cytochrome b562
MIASELIHTASDPAVTPDMIWEWARSILALLGPAIGLPGLIALLLQRKQANKKLDLDEKGSDITEFQALNTVSASIVQQARQAMLDAQTAATEARTEAAAAKKDANTYRSEREELKGEIDHALDIVRKLRDLFKSYVTRVGVPLTADEQSIFESTVDPGTLPGRRRKR